MTPRWLASSEARSGGREGTARSPEGWPCGRRGLVASPARRPRLPRAPGPGLGREGELAPHMGPENSPKRHTSPRPSSLAEASHVTAVAGEGRFLGPLWPPQRLSPHRAPGLSRALFLGLSRLRDTQVACSGRTSRRGGVSGRVATKSTHRAAQEIGGSQWAGTPPEASRVPMLVGRGGRGAGSRGSAAPVGSCATHVSSTRWQHPSSRPPAG